MKVFSAKFGGVPHPPMIGFKQSVKVFSTKFSLNSYGCAKVFSLESLSAHDCKIIIIDTCFLY